MQTLETCRNCGAALTGDIDWCGQCYSPVSRPERIVVVPEAAERAAPPVDLGVKALFSILVVVFGVSAFIALDRIVVERGSALWATSILFLGAYAALGIVGIFTAWRPPEG